jgi:hypothetical protein
MARATKKEKFADLCEFEGITAENVERFLFDSVQPAICMNIDCDETAGMEPDQSSGYCEDCKTGSMVALEMFILEGYYPPSGKESDNV